MTNWKESWNEDVTESSSVGPRRLKLKPGTVTTVRLATPYFADAWVHHVTIKGQGDKSYIRRFVCLGKGACPLCEMGDKAKHRFYYNVIDVKEMKEKNEVVVRLLETGPEIYKQIRSIVNDEDYEKHTPTSYNFKIERQGKGQYDTSYYVKASPKISPLSKKILALIDRPTEEGGKYNLDEQKTKLTKGEILDIIKGDTKEKEEVKEDNVTASKNGLIKDKKINKPIVEVEEGFNLDAEVGSETDEDMEFKIDDIDDANLGEDF